VGGGPLARSGSPFDKAAADHGISVSAVSLAWTLHRSPVMLPIPGTSSVAHLEENVAAASVELSADEWAAIEEAAA
jgi:aryl-alcohol dehydrogenase-like predicted oxidoreductase